MVWKTDGVNRSFCTRNLRSISFTLLFLCKCKKELLKIRRRKQQTSCLRENFFFPGPDGCPCSGSGAGIFQEAARIVYHYPPLRKPSGCGQLWGTVSPAEWTKCRNPVLHSPEIVTDRPNCKGNLIQEQTYQLKPENEKPEMTGEKGMPCTWGDELKSVRTIIKLDT